MKYNNFFIALALCAAMQPGISFGMENPIAEEIAQEQELKSQEPVNQSYFQRAKSYAASWIPQSVKDTVNSWSPRKKMVVAGAIIGTLAAIYNREQIMQWVSDLLPLSQTDLLQIQKLEKSLEPVMQERDQARLTVEKLRLAMDWGANDYEARQKLSNAKVEFLEKDKKMWDILKLIEEISPEEEKKVYDNLQIEYKNPFPGAI